MWVPEGSERINEVSQSRAIPDAVAKCHFAGEASGMD
jgi:hypothetical protein